MCNSFIFSRVTKMTTKSNKMYKTKPLENLTIDIEEDGISRKVPALSSYFITPRSPIQFTAPPKKNKQGQFLLGAKEDWLCKIGNLQIKSGMVIESSAS
uniref:Activating signal cointegrator 1 complex subunit 2 isoform x1 n=1 Tax=Triatoma infestans TaxID=30076 RepID=A0A161ME66_TRIIF